MLISLRFETIVLDNAIFTKVMAAIKERFEMEVEAYHINSSSNFVNAKARHEDEIKTLLEEIDDQNQHWDEALAARQTGGATFSSSSSPSSSSSSYSSSSPSSRFINPRAVGAGAGETTLATRETQYFFPPLSTVRRSGGGGRVDGAPIASPGTVYSFPAPDPIQPHHDARVVVPENILQLRRQAIEHENKARTERDLVVQTRAYFMAACCASKAGDHDNARRLVKEVERVAAEAERLNVPEWGNAAHGAVSIWGYLTCFGTERR
jgi:hypothetical protein